MPRVTFLFWNLNRQPATEYVAALVSERDVDVVILAENVVSPMAWIEALSLGPDRFHFFPGLYDKVQVFARFDSSMLIPCRDGRRFSIRILKIPKSGEVLLAGVHLRDKRNHGPESQAEECWHLAREIERAEDDRGHRRTILVGDLNASPHEFGLISAYRLNATLSRRIAGREDRAIGDIRARFFFNPMWSKYNDDSDGAPATYFYHRGDEVSYYWHMVDQVLLRPSLLSGFKSSDLEIVSQIGNRTLLRNGKPDAKLVSDHLPLLFSIDLQ
ncbi:MAG: endonuclease/exonuclease/phosphatase family protein [Pirellulaceae bacterium]